MLNMFIHLEISCADALSVFAERKYFIDYKDRKLEHHRVVEYYTEVKPVKKVKPSKAKDAKEEV